MSKHSIAAKESRETHYWLRLLGSTGVLPEADLHDLLEECNPLVTILTAIIKKTKENAQ